MAESDLVRRTDTSALDSALELIKGELDGRTASFINACVRCGLCADTCHVHLADGEVDSIPAHKVEKFSRLFRRYRTLLGRFLPRLVGAEELSEQALQALATAAFGLCTGCGRCALHCSVGMDPAAVLRFARAVLVAAGLVPAGIRNNMEGTIEAGNNMRIDRHDVVETVEWLEEDLRDTLADSTASMPLDRKGARVLYAINPRELKFFPLSLSAAGMIFHVAKEDWTLSSTDFDVTNYGFFAADAEGAAKIAGQLIRRAEDLEVEELVMSECGHGYRSIRWEAEQWHGRGLPLRVRSFVELMYEYLREGRITLDPANNPDIVTLHDPCNLVRNGGVIEEQRYLLRRAVSNFVEMTPNREHNYCCGGGGGLLAASEYKEKRIKAGKIKADQIRATGAKIVATPCHNCIDQLMELNQHYNLQVELKTVGEIVAEALVFVASRKKSD